MFELCLFYFRVVCGNHIVWDAEDVTRIRHNRLAPEHFDRDVMPALVSYANSATADVTERVKRAMQYMLPDQRDERVTFLRNYR